MKPADPRDVRRHNLSLVLREVAERGPRSRATIALETGLNKTTVSSLVAELIELGLLRESGLERPGAVGRPAQRVEIDPTGPFVLGLEVNVDYLAAEASDLAGVTLHRSFVASDNRADPSDVLSRLLGIGESGVLQQTTLEHYRHALSNFELVDMTPEALRRLARWQARTPGGVSESESSIPP